MSQAKPKTEIVTHMSLLDSAIRTLLIHRSLFWSVIWPSVPMESFLGHANQRIWGYFSTFYCFCWFRRPVFWGVDPLREDKWQTEPSKRELLLTLNMHPIFEYTGDERHCIVFHLFAQPSQVRCLPASGHLFFWLRGHIATTWFGCEWRENTFLYL